MIKNNHPSSKPITKKSAIHSELAKYLLTLNINDPVQNIRDLASQLGASIGLISETISGLENLSAIEIERRGQLGSFIKNMSIGRLWEVASGGPMVISHTLPSNRRYEGLATGIKQSFNEAGIEAYFIFIRGSRTRLQALREGRCQIAILSCFAADGLQKKQDTVALELPEGSFVGEHFIYYRQVADQPGQTRIAAVDKDSYDQFQLSKIEFEGQDVLYKNITFMNIHRYLTDKQVDMAIWTAEDMENRLGNSILRRPLSTKTSELVKKKNTKAALVVRSDDIATQAVIRKVLQPDKLIAIQQAVLDGLIVPEY